MRGIAGTVAVFKLFVNTFGVAAIALCLFGKMGAPCVTDPDRHAAPIKTLLLPGLLFLAKTGLPAL